MGVGRRWKKLPHDSTIATRPNRRVFRPLVLPQLGIHLPPGPRLLVDGLPAPLAGDVCPRILLPFLIRLLPPELVEAGQAVGGQLSAGHRRQHRAARLTLMLAVP